jgi:two-component sensor histidine kinase
VLVDDRTSWVPPRLDLALAALFVALSLAEVFVNGTVRSPLEHVLVTGVAMSSLAWRRRFPLVVAGLVIASNLVVNPQGEFSTLLSLVLVSFTIGAETAPPRSHVGLAIVLVPFLAAMVTAGLVPSDVAAALVFIVGPWSVGSLFRQRSAYAAEAADLAAVEATAREALAEMRRLFGVLRTDGETAALAPQPGLAELRRLVAQAGTGDLAVRLEVEGEPYELPPGLDLAAYRIAQEGLTNALRHSGATEACVRVRYGDRHVDVEVVDNGRGLPRERVEGAPAGHGLVGIRERVALYDGTVELAPEPAGGVRLSARLPVGAVS